DAHPGVLQADVGRDGRAAFALDALAFFAAEELQHVHDHVQMLVGGGRGIGQAVGNAGPAVAVQGVGALGQDGYVPLAHHLGVVLQLGQDVPVAFQEHGAVAGKEGGAGAGLGKVGLGGAPVVLLQVDVKLHPHPGGGVVEVGAGLVLGQDAAAGLVDKVPVAQLVVAVGHVAVIAGGVVDLLGCFTQGVPGPGVVGIADPG